MTQWNPSTVVRCFIVGYLPIIICGQGTSAINYASHSDDIKYPGPFGGGISSMRFTLRILYDQYLRGQNFWTKSNEDLDLARFKGSKWKFYRHKTTDFIVSWETSAPFTDSIVSGPHQHPGIQMLMKKKVIIPSFLTKPKGKSTITVRIQPPKLMVDKWYPQTEFCEVTLLTIHATACDLRFPFCSPQTTTPCITFNVLSGDYTGKLSILPDQQTEQKLKEFVTIILQSKPTVLNTLATPYNLKWPAPVKKPGTTTQNYSPDSQDGDQIYQDFSADNWMQNNKIWFDKAVTAWTNLHSAYNKPTSRGLEMHTGMYSSIFLSPSRLNPQFPGLYTTIIYNPLTDKGEGNKIWADPLTKSNMEYEPPKSKYLISDLQLWAAVTGYADYCTKASKDESFIYNYRVVIQCPYTVPQLFIHTQPTKGYIPYSSDFGWGRMPGGDPQIPVRWRCRWYPALWNQQPVLEDIFMSGPFTYKGDEKSATLSAKYAFKWLWGGNRIFQQVVKDPCSHQQDQAVGPSRKPRTVQVFDPRYQAPEWAFHAWDLRRGLFGRSAIKRVSAKPTPDELLSTGPKRPRLEIPAFQEGQEESLLFRKRKHKAYEDSSQTETEAQSEEEEDPQQQLELLHRIQQQRLLGRSLRCLFQQLTQTQMGLHVDPQLLAQV